MMFSGTEACALCGDRGMNVQFFAKRHDCTVGMLRFKWSGTAITYIAVGLILFCVSAVLALSIWNWIKLPPEFGPECFCGDENFCIPPLLSLHPAIQRKFFNCSLGAYVEKFGLRATDHLQDISTFKTDDLVFVTATSSNHFTLARGLIQNLRQFHPISKIVFYDLGLNDEEREEIKQLCNVEYIRFPFENYPPHVQDLMNYAWKVMILAEQHQLGRPFIYMDASVRLTRFYIPERILELANAGQIEPYTMLQHVYHSIKATTTPGFYDYIPMPETITQIYRMDSAGIQLVLPSNYTRTIMKWQALCALTPDCIAPTGHQVKCVFEDTDRFLNYHNCHRYDQTLLNSLVARMLFGDDNYALRFNYTDQSTPLDSWYLVKRAFKRRKARYHEVNQMFRLDRNDFIHEPIQMLCTIEQELLAALR